MSDPSSISGIEAISPLTCRVPRCSHSAAAGREGLLGFCHTHLDAASPSARRRLGVTTRRLAALQALWDDPHAYDRVVASGRYLKLSHATCAAIEMSDAARERVMLSILQAQAKGSGGASLEPPETRAIA